MGIFRRARHERAGFELYGAAVRSARDPVWFTQLGVADTLDGRFDLVGLQRHIKVLGIFARLWYRDGKSGYLPDLPRTFDYVLDGARRFPELRELAQWLQRRVSPLFGAANARALATQSP